MRLSSQRMNKRARGDNSTFYYAVRIILVVAIIAFVWAQTHLVINTEYIYEDKSIPKSLVGYNIIHISDLKNTKLNIIRNVRKADADIIVITGGYLDSNGNSGNTEKLVKDLVKIAPVYYICNPVDEDVLKDTGAINIADKNVELTVEAKTAEQFIKETYGDNILKKASANDKLSMQYIEYITQSLLDTANAKINLFGLDNYTEDGGMYKARDKAYEILLDSDADYDIALLGNIGLLSEVCKAEIDMLMFGGTYGTNQISNKYIKGMYANQGTHIFVSNGIATPKGTFRFMNFPSVQIITLSDGTIEDNNPLEKFLGYFIKDVGTIFDNDGGFQEHVYEYGKDF